MAGYSRQSVADIISGEVVKAAPLNAEYNALRDAFAFAGGHNHDGSSTEGAYVGLIADVDANNKVVVDTSNNRVSFYTEVSGSPVEQIRVQDGAIVPVTDDDIDLGASGLEFKNLFIDGTANIDALVSAAVTITGGNIDGTIIGATTPAAGTFSSLTATTADINGGTVDNATIGATTPSSGAFTTLTSSGGITGNITSTGTSTFTTVDINGGAIDGTAVGATTPANVTGTAVTSTTGFIGDIAGDVTGDVTGNVTGDVTGNVTGNLTGNVTSTGTSTFTTVDINGGAIDGTAIGASSASTGAFTTVTTSGQATLASADINGGTADGVVIGGATPAAGTFTTVTANTGITGTVTGNVTGNLTGNVTGNVAGDVTGDLTGNVTASSGSSTFNDVTVNGTLDVTGTTIANVTDPVNAQDAATKNYVDTSVSNLVDSAPGALDTLNELAAAIGDDANFSTTITNSIATKLPLAGGTMSGAIAMGTSKITGMGDPTANQDAATKAYVDTGDAAQLSLSGGTMTGAIDMGANKITTTYTPTDNADLTTKTYVDGILGSATAAATSAANAATSETNAATSETNAATSETNAATSEANAAASYDSFDDRYLGAKSSAPTLDNDGDALIVGALYFDTTDSTMKVYSASGWVAAGSAVNGTANRYEYTVGTASGSYAGSSLNTFPATYDSGFVDVYLNGVKLVPTTDFTATTGTTIVLASDAVSGDLISIIGYGTFELANFSVGDANDVDLSGGLTNNDILQYDSTSSDFLPTTAPTFTSLDVTGTVTADGLTVDTDTLHVDATNNRVGIGTDSPSDLLELSGSTAQPAIRFTDEDVAGLYHRVFTPTNTGLAISADTGNVAANSFLRFDVDGTERMRIDSSGNLGIGTTSPDAPLTVQGGSATSATIQLKGGALANDNASIHSLYNLYLKADSSESIANRNIIFQVGSTDAMRIDSSGNVGIGVTPSTSANLTNIEMPQGVQIGARNLSGVPQMYLSSNVSGDAYAPTYKVNGYATQYRIESSGGQHEWYTAPSGTAGNAITFTRAMTLDSSGRLLIGTTNSVNDIHVDRTDTAASLGLQARGTGNPDTFITFGDNDDYNVGMIVYKHTDDSMRFTVNASEAMTIDSDGTVSASRGLGATETASKSGTVTPDMDTYTNFVWTLTGNITLGNPGDEATGQSGVFIFIHSGAARTVSLSSDWETAGAAGLTLSGASGAVDIVPYFVQSSGNILLGAPQLAFS